MTSKPFVTCLWFDEQGEEAAQFYTGIFKSSRITGVQRYTEAGPRPAGAVPMRSSRPGAVRVPWRTSAISSSPAPSGAACAR